MNHNVCMTNSGIKYEGSWEEICDFSEGLEDVIKEGIHDSSEIKHFHEWRPREKDGKNDISHRTAEEASIKQKKIEREFKGTKEEITEAEQKFKESIDDVKHLHNPSRDIKDASKHIENLVEAKSVQSLRKMEEMIYEKLMLKFNPYYFDTEDFSINLNDEKNKDFTLIINIPDEEKRKKVKDILSEDGFECLN
ncbi:MAG: DUF5828 family protein [Thermoplasmata archaeon]